MAQVIEVDGIGPVEFPDDMPLEQIDSTLRSKEFWEDAVNAGYATDIPPYADPDVISSATQSGLANLQRVTGVLYGYLSDDKENAANLIVEQSKRLKEIGVPPGVQEVYQSQGFGDTLANLITNPETVPYTVIQSLTQFSPVLAAAFPQLAAAGPTFGITGVTGVGTIGAGSLALEAGHTMLEELEHQGVDLTDRDQVLAALNDPGLMETAKDRGLKKGLPIAMFDMVAGGFAGRLFPKGGVLGRAGKELGVQAALGGAGETAGQITEQTLHDRVPLSEVELGAPDIVLEAVGELGTGPVEVVAGMYATRGQATGDAKDVAGHTPLEDTTLTPSDYDNQKVTIDDQDGAEREVTILGMTAEGMLVTDAGFAIYPEAVKGVVQPDTVEPGPAVDTDAQPDTAVEPSPDPTQKIPSIPEAVGKQRRKMTAEERAQAQAEGSIVGETKGQLEKAHAKLAEQYASREDLLPHEAAGVVPADLPDDPIEEVFPDERIRKTAEQLAAEGVPESLVRVDPSVQLPEGMTAPNTPERRAVVRQFTNLLQDGLEYTGGSKKLSEDAAEMVDLEGQLYAGRYKLSAIGRQKTKKKKEAAQKTRQALLDRYNQLRGRLGYSPVPYDRVKRPTAKQGNVHSITKRYGKLTPQRLASIEAYHGGQPGIERMELDKVGTGEQHAAFGWGLYFADLIGVARWYKQNESMRIGTGVYNIKVGDTAENDVPGDALFGILHTAGLKKFKLGIELAQYTLQNLEFSDVGAADIVAETILYDLARNNKDISIALRKEASNALSLDENNSIVAEQYRELARFVLNELPKIAVETQESAGLYKVNIDALSEQFLLWDAPMEQQSDIVREALRHTHTEVDPYSEGVTGENIYRGLENSVDEGFNQEIHEWGEANGVDLYTKEGVRRPDRLISLYFNSLGIKGIKYLDNTSRDKAGGIANDIRVKKWGDNEYELRMYNKDTGQKFGEWYNQSRKDLEKFLGKDLTDNFVNFLETQEVGTQEIFNTEVIFEGSYNYVIFDDSLINITERGLAQEQENTGWTPDVPSRESDSVELRMSKEGEPIIVELWKASDEYLANKEQLIKTIERIIERVTHKKTNVEYFETETHKKLKHDGTLITSELHGWQWMNTIAVALRGNRQIDTAYHEAWHFLVDGEHGKGLDILSAEDKQILQDALPQFREMIDQIYPNQDIVYPDYEVIAHIAGHYMNIKDRGMNLTELLNIGSREEKVFEKVRKILKRIAKATRRLLGIRDWEQIFDEASNGTLLGNWLAEQTGMTVIPQSLEKPINRPASETLTPQQIEAEGNQYNFVNDMSNKFNVPQYMEDMNLYEKFVNSPRHLAQQSIKFAKYFTQVKDMHNHRMKIISRASDKLRAYGNASDEVKAKLDTAMELAALQNGRYRMGADNRIYIVNDGLEDSGGKAVLSSPGEVVVLEPEVARIYTSVQEVMNDLLKDMHDAYIINNFDLLKRAMGGELTTHDAKEMSGAAIREVANASADAGIKDRLTLLANQVGSIEGHMTRDYAPLSRHGDVGIRVKDAQGREVMFETYDTKGILKSKRWNGQKIEARRQELLKEFPASEGYDVTPAFRLTYDVLKKELRSGNAVADIDTMMGMLGTADNEAWNEIRQTVDETLRTQGWAGHLARKKKTPGYSTDFARSIAMYVMGASNYASRTMYEPHVQKAIDEIKAPEERKYAQKHFGYMTSPQEEFSFLRGLGFAWYLGGNISSAVIQWAAVPQFTYGHLTQFAPAEVVTKEIFKAMKDAWAAMGGGIAKAQLGDFKDVRKSIDFTKAARNPQELEALQRAIDEGELTPLQTLELVGLSPAENAIRYGKASNVWESTQQWLASLFNIFETTGRIVAFLTTYRIMQNPEYRDNANAVLSNDQLWRQKSSESAMQDMPYNLGTHAIEDTFGLFGKINRPTMMRGPGASIFQFAQFPLYMIELMYRTAKRGFKGVSRQQRRAGKKAFATMLLSMFLTAGLWGLPGADDTKELIEWILRNITKEDIDLDAELREMIEQATGSNYVAEMVARGGMRALGVDVHQRIGLGEIPQMKVVRGILGANMDLGDVFGVPYSLIVKTPQNINEKMAASRELEAFLEGTPIFVKKLMQGMFIFPEEGVVTAKGKQIIRPQDISVLDVALNSVGFTPTHIAEAREKERAVKRASTADRDLRNSLTKRLAGEQVAIMRARARNDEVGVVDGRRRLKKLLDKAREHGILDKALRRAAAERARQMFSPDSPKARNKGVPKRKRRDVRRIRELYSID